MFKGIIDLKKAMEDQRKLSETINELEKKINIRRGRPLSNENKDDIENLIKNGREILTTRKDIIKAYSKLKREGEPNLMNFDDDGNNNDDDGKDDGNNDDDRNNDDDGNDDGNNNDDDKNNDEDDGNNDRKMPDWVGVSRKRFNEIKKLVKNYKNNNLSDCNWTRTHNHLVHKRTLNRPVWLNG